MYIILLLSTLVLLFMYTSYYYRKIAYYDDLTGVLRRKVFEKELVKRMRFVKNNPKYILQFFMIDLDDFKTINDTHGHEAGDAVLRLVSKNLNNSIKVFSLLKSWKKSKNPLHYNDIVGRLGGDEFAVCCMVTKDYSDELSTILGEILNKTVDSNFKLNHSISIGMSVFIHSMPINVERLKEEADKKLYYSKNTGKGRITT